MSSTNSGNIKLTSRFVSGNGVLKHLASVASLPKK